MHRPFIAVLCGTLALASFSCVSSHPLRETSAVRIGFFGDLGAAAAATEGGDALKGAELRVALANAAGGVGGRAVELFSIDMKQSPAEAVKAYTQLVQEYGVCMVVGSMVTNAGVAVSPVADLSHVPLLSLGDDDRVTTPDVNAQNPEKAGAARRFSFIVHASATQSAQALAWYVVDHFTMERFATLYDPASPVSVLQAHAFENVLKSTGRLVTASVPMPEGDLAPAMHVLSAVPTEAVYVCASVEKNAAAARALRETLPLALLLGNQSWYAPLISLAGEAADKAWFSMPVAPDDYGVAELTPAFSARFASIPSPAAIEGWDAVGLVLAAVRKAGTSDPVRLRDTLEQAVSFKIVQGTWSMDRRTHRPEAPPVAIMQIVGSSYRTVDPRYLHRPPHQ